MLRNFLIIAFRNLVRHRTFSTMNILGLTLGISCALFIFLLARFENSYDQFNTKRDRIYRINQGAPAIPMEEFDTGTPTGVTTFVRAEIPEVELLGNVYKLNPEQSQIEFGNERTRVNELYYVSPQFFEMTDFTWIHGSPSTSLGTPGQAVLTESMARKFYRGDALGKVIRLNNAGELTISGIIADPPLNSDFPFEVVMSYATYEKWEGFNPTELEASNSYQQTFVLVKPGVTSEQLDAKLKQILVSHLGQEKADKDRALRAQPLSDIHFRVGNFSNRTMSRTTLETLNLIGLFILGIACINFTNLASALAIRRSREVGIRKSLGSPRKVLMLQFLGETFLVVTCATILSYILVGQLVLISYKLTEIPLNVSVLNDGATFMFLAIVLVVMTAASGGYPAFILSGFKPVEALRNSVTTARIGGLTLRKSLIAFQFVVSQVLLVATLVVIRQVDHFNNLPLGFDKVAVLTSDVPVQDAAKLSSLKNRLLEDPSVLNVTYSLNTPAATINKWWGNLHHRSLAGENNSAEIKAVDSAYFPMFGIRKIAGTTEMRFDSMKHVVVNRDLAKTIGFEDPADALGEKVSFWGNEATIIGVVEDFQTVSLHEGMHPVIMVDNPGMIHKMSMKINMSDAPSTIRHLQTAWSQAFPDYYFTYSFLDSDLQTFYKEDRKISGLLVAFASVAIGIGCIGLFGLIMFTSAQRTKEIGIRKILGATISSIVGLLSKEFVVLVVIAGVIAWPLGYYAMSSWLSGFENSINLIDNGWIFALSTIMAVVFALVTVGFQALKAALVNPSRSLRSE